jgi:hypothetical protein
MVAADMADMVDMAVAVNTVVVAACMVVSKEDMATAVPMLAVVVSNIQFWRMPALTVHLKDFGYSGGYSGDTGSGGADFGSVVGYARDPYGGKVTPQTGGSQSGSGSGPIQSNIPKLKYDESGVYSEAYTSYWSFMYFILGIWLSF